MLRFAARNILCYELALLTMWLMKKRPGERELQPNPLITLFPEVHGWIREDDRIRTLGIYLTLALLTVLVYPPCPGVISLPSATLTTEGISFRFAIRS